MQSIKILILLLILSFNANLAFTQNSSSVIGEVIEVESEEAMEFVNVILYEFPDNIFLQGTVSDKEGRFKFSDIQVGEYYLELSFIGFETKKTENFKVEQVGEEVDLDEITIEISEQILEDVEVTAEKSTYNMSIDRKIYNVEKDILASASSATQILQNIPSVSVDVNGEVSLRGTSNITYFINGRPSAMMRNNTTAALQQIPANTIERVEVITNPSAKYKPDGAGGIINIVLKEESEVGFNGTLIGNIGNLQRYNGNLTLNYGLEDVNFFASYGYRHSDTPREDIIKTINKDGMGNTLSTSDENINANFDKTSHLVNAGLTYDLSDNDVLEISGNYYFGKDDKKTTNKENFVNLFEPAESQSFTTDQNFKEEEQEYEIAAVLEHEFDDDHTLALEYVYADFSEEEGGTYIQNFTVPSAYDTIISNLIEIGGPTHEVAIEYANPIGEDTELEAGYVGEFLKEEINFLGQSKASMEGPFVIDPLRTSSFIFTQNIHALYATLAHSIGEYSFLGGMRAEQAFVTSNLANNNEEIPNDYFKLYPTVHIAYELGDEQEIQLSYSKRVNRADSDEQNPFPEYSDTNSREVGNPLLKPELIHSFELSYRLQLDRFTFLPSIYYRYKQDAFTEIVRTVENNITETSFTNLDNERFAGFEFILTGTPNDFLSFDLSANTFYQKIDARDLGFSKEKDSYSFDAKLGANIKVTKSTNAQINAYYRSSRITPQGEFQPIFLLNAGVRQEIFKNRASILLTVSDVFNTLDYESFIDTPTLDKRTNYGRNSQILYVGFIYHFGKSVREKNKKLSFEDEIEAGKKAPEEEEEE